MSEQKKIKQLEEENRRLKDAIGALTEAVNVFTQSVESIGICDASKKVDTHLEKAQSTSEQVIQTVLNQFGVKHSINGYLYLVSAVKRCLMDRKKLNNVVKGLYTEVAEEYETTTMRVERAIRHAIESSWERGNMNVINNVFGYTVLAAKGKPTNTEFIALLTDFISLHYKKLENETYNFGD